MTDVEELFEIASKLKAVVETSDTPEVNEPLIALEKSAKEIGAAASGSWLGYHSCVYYADLKPPPPGAHFSQEWGMKELFSDIGSTGNWGEWDREKVISIIEARAGNPNLDRAHSAAAAADSVFSVAKADALSILTQELESKPDGFLEKLKAELESLAPLSSAEILRRWKPSGQIITRDMVAAGQGYRVPPHKEPLAEVTSIRHSFAICDEAARTCAKAASHLERRGRRKKAAERVGTNVFIGHGQSGAWRELKDFVQDRLKLPWDEFNRVPVAGWTNIARLAEMLDAAAVAFLVLTGEDETADGDLHARMNVIHEAGLFQGRLGFTKAIVLLEDGCKEFSNIQGLGQIRFPKGRISAAFEDVRRVLEREQMI